MVIVLVALAMAVGTIGTVVPVLPGLAVVWGAALAYGLAEGFGAVGTVAFVVITALAAAGTLAGWILPKRAAEAAGASRSSIWLGIALAIPGFFAIPVVGLAIGGLAGLYAGEYQRTHDHAIAWQATRRTVVGFGLAVLVQFLAALAMVLTWAVWVFVD
jgi:uncharacterized protein YqgC (DUF456 family)